MKPIRILSSFLKYNSFSKEVQGKKIDHQRSISMIQKYMRIDLNKNSKPIFYIKSILIYLIPSFFFQMKLADAIQKAQKEPALLQRVHYYNKTTPFKPSPNLKTIQEFYTEKKKTYFFDLLRYLKYFNQKLKISYLFGDITHVPNEPTIVKSRPIKGNNANSILMKLNSVRHFIFVDDTLTFESKVDKIVWRGKCYVPHRIEFVKKFYNHPLCDIGQTNTKGDLSVAWQKNKLSLKKQLEYKFILAIEGNDVASNLKWAMSSNSLVMMCEPKYETWFMEGLLKADFHYVLLKDDYSDLEEKIEYYIKNHQAAKDIIANAHKHVAQFLDAQSEEIISLKVLEKYFLNSHQL